MTLKEIALDVIKFGKTHDDEATRFMKSNEQRLNENFRKLKESCENIMADFGDYYTKSEADALLAGKSNVGHNHDSRYYTETEIDTTLARGLLYKGLAESASTDLNNITTAGIYYMRGGTFTNAPSPSDWCYLLVLTNPTTVQISQIIYKPTSAPLALTWQRTYSGNPASWSNWINNYTTGYGNLGKTGITLSAAPSAVSVATATWKSLGSLELTAGRWVVFANARFNSNATGYREILGSSSADDGTQLGYIFHDIRPAVNGTYTYCSFSSWRSLTANTTLYLNAYQNSGSSLNAIGRIYAIQVC